VNAAAWRAKEQGTNACQFYTVDMDVAGLRRIELEGGLRRALDNGELEVYYQPKVSSMTREIVGAEALVRWRHPERGLLPPSEFIPFAEEVGLIAPISEWVLQTVCKQNMQWAREKLKPVRVDRKSTRLNSSHVAISYA